MNIEMLPMISFVVITTFTPGPNNISSTSMGLIYGYRKTVNYLLGISFGFFVIQLACACLSNIMLRTLPEAGNYLRWIGAAYIIWLALGIMRYDHSGEQLGKSAGVKAFTKGFVLQIVNPKALIYGLTLYSTFLSPIVNHPVYLITAAAACSFTAFAATSTWALFGSVIKDRLENNSFRKAIKIFLAFLLIYTAVEISGLTAFFHIT